MSIVDLKNRSSHVDPHGKHSLLLCVHFFLWFISLGKFVILIVSKYPAQIVDEFLGGLFDVLARLLLY